MVKKTHQRGIRYAPRAKRKPRQSRVRSFATEKAAMEYADKKGLKDYTIKQLRLGLSKKFTIQTK